MEETGTAAHAPGSAGLSAAERAAVDAAERLATVPSTFTAAHRQELERHFPPPRAEWFALSVAMMGFLNKFMDAAGVPLEDATVAEVEPILGPAGWKAGRHLDHPVQGGPPPPRDGMGMMLGVLRHAPAAAVLDRRWTAGVPGNWPALGDYLRERTGHDFPVLGRLHHKRPRRALGTMLRDNLEAGASNLGLPLKMVAGLVFAITVHDEALAGEARLLASHAGVAEPTLDAVAEFAAPASNGAVAERLGSAAASLEDLDRTDDRGPVVVALAAAASTSPAAVPPQLIATAGAVLSPAALVELLVWISVMQLLHRLSAYFGA